MNVWKKDGGKKLCTVSMRVPLIIFCLLLVLIPAVIQSRIFISSVEREQINDRMIEVKNQGLILSNKLGKGGYMENVSSGSAMDVEMDTTADIFNGRIVIVDRDYRVIRDTFDLSVGRIYIAEEVLKCFQGENSSRYNEERDYFALTLPIYNGIDGKSIEGVMVMTVSTENMGLLPESMAEKADFFLLVVAIVTLLLVIALANVYFRPLVALKAALNRVADGNLDEDVEINTYKETQEISTAVQRTLTKLKAVEQSRQEFVSNVSHELKTPITSIRVLADSLMGMEEAPVELYKEFMADISDEIDRETKIINDLLTLVKSDKATTELNVAQVSINRLLEQILKRLGPIAEKRNVDLVLENIREVTADVDETKLSLALSNLVENAIKYNREDGWVRVVLDADHKFFYVKVIDNGIGIPAEFQEKVFERFYRVDKARSRETGGTGLGLAITKSIIQMHNGALKLQSKEGEGTTFTVRVPLNYIS